MVDLKPIDKAKVEAEAKANGTEPKEKTGIANPATTKCLKDGLMLKKTYDIEGETNICVFDDNTECDEWAYFRGECKKGDCKDWKTCAPRAAAEPASPSGTQP